MNINAMAMPIGNSTGQAAAAASDAVSGQALPTSGSNPFEALVMRLMAEMTGEYAEPSSANGMSSELLKLLGGQSEEPSNTEEDVLSVLDQLAALFADLPVDIQQQLAEDPQVTSWLAKAVDELVMNDTMLDGGIDLIPSKQEQQFVNQVQRSEFNSSRFLEVLKQLAAALEANPEQPHLKAVAAEGERLFSVVKEALPALQDRPQSASTMSALLQIADSSKHSGSSGELNRMLERMEGALDSKLMPLEPALSPKVMTHLFAMDAKARLAVVQTTPETSDAAVVAPDATRTLETAGMNGMMEQVRSGAVEALSKADSILRIPAASFAEQMGAWLVKQSMSGKQLTEATIKLVPEHLGQVEVKLTLHNGQLTAMFTAETGMAKDVLESSLAQLRTNLQTQGITVEKLEVAQQDLSSGMFQDSRQGRQSGNAPERENRQRDDSESEELTEFWEVGLEEAKFRTEHGNSFSATA